MPKAIVCIGPTQIVNDIPAISYTVSVIGPPNYSYGADFQVNTSLSINNNLLNWRNKIISQALENEVILLVTDIVVFGAPS